MRKRFGRWWLARASYTWSRTEGEQVAGDYVLTTNPDDRPHAVSALLLVTPAPWISGGLGYRYISGVPFQRRFRADVESGFIDYRGRVGVNPGGNINDPTDDRSPRGPALSVFDLQLRGKVDARIVRFDVYADILNMFPQSHSVDPLYGGSGSEGSRGFRLARAPEQAT